MKNKESPKYTPGPWRLTDENRAALIAAAPELLGALRELLAWAESNVAPERLHTTREITLARAAIAKAEGSR